MEHSKEYYLEEEMIIVRQSGEIPEVALHGSLYYLSEDPEGPKVTVTTEERRRLAEQALERFVEIILRDLTPENRDKSLYRGLLRSAANWQRCVDFCAREGFSVEEVRPKVVAALLDFLQLECLEVAGGQCCSSINCSSVVVEEFVCGLGISLDDLPAGWRELCNDG